ncbi:MAG: DUF5937 family protein [Stackebrandtia sp.]
MTRFAFSPLWELIASVRVLKDPNADATHRPWLDWARTRVARSDRDFGLLLDLVPVPTRVIPAFVAPPPHVTAPDFADELAAMRAVPTDDVRKNLDAMTETRSPRLTRLYEEPEQGLKLLAELLTAYWDLVLAPLWPRVRMLCEADVMHRARRLATGGAESLFNDLHPTVSWRADRLLVRQLHARGTRRLTGRGLLLTPSVFVPRVFTLTAGDWQPTLRYPPRGIASLWHRPDAAAPKALAAVLGASRADLLSRLAAPASTSELALRTGLSPGGVSQHLTALHAAGLVQRHRMGRFVLYVRTTTAERLLAGVG